MMTWRVVLLLLAMLVLGVVCNQIRTPGAVAADPVLNVPMFSGSIPAEQSAITWFGSISDADNWSDVRIGHNSQQLYIRVSTVDRRLWFLNPPANPAAIRNQDAVSVFLERGSERVRFDIGVTHDPDRSRWQAAYRLVSGQWQPATIAAAITTAWRGDGLSTSADDRGWVADLTVPWSSLGGVPSNGVTGRLGVQVHDLDESGGTVRRTSYPAQLQTEQPATWRSLRFGLPTFQVSVRRPTTEHVIRQGLNGATVTDVTVGGANVGNCGGMPDEDFFRLWGTANQAGRAESNVQNQADIADWPCFSRYYVTFPLSSLPRNRVVTGAMLELHQFGQAGGPDWQPPATRTLVQVSEVGQDWQESSVNWNNAPLPTENMSYGWVDLMAQPLQWPGVKRSIDVSRLVDRAYRAGQPARMVLYSADMNYHSGKYFSSSDTGEWNAVARPTLRVQLTSAGTGSTRR